jgi:hypothetical protein
VVARRVAGQQNRRSFEAAGVRACFCDPDSHEVYLPPPNCSLTSLPTQSAHLAGKPKQERSGGYVKDNALEAGSLAALRQNAFLRHRNRTIAHFRIHGTTQRRV